MKSNEENYMIDEILREMKKELVTSKDLKSIYVSIRNHRNFKKMKNCLERGVKIKVGDICYIDFGNAFIYEIGYQHFAIILSIINNKAFVVPMSGNPRAYKEAYDEDNLTGKKHLMKLGKIGCMNKESTLFINDAKWISTARIIDVKAHLNINNEMFYKIQKRVINSILNKE